jgi:hypothetical protein
MERASAPKGLYDTARGFNPGNRSQPRGALKGLEIDRPKNVCKECSWQKDWIAFSGAHSGRVTGGRCFLGLKPQAESWCPFGARDRAKLRHTFTNAFSTGPGALPTTACQARTGRRSRRST